MTWHADDEFWATFGPALFTEERLGDAKAEVDEALRLAGVPLPDDDGQPPPAALDLCCGPGRHSLELRRRGLRVTGVDRTASYLAQASARAAQERLDNDLIEFVESDMREFFRPDAFQLVVNLYTSFGYFEDPADDVTVLAVRRDRVDFHGVTSLSELGTSDRRIAESERFCDVSN